MVGRVHVFDLQLIEYTKKIEFPAIWYVTMSTEYIPSSFVSQQQHLTFPTCTLALIHGLSLIKLCM